MHTTTLLFKELLKTGCGGKREWKVEETVGLEEDTETTVRVPQVIGETFKLQTKVGFAKMVAENEDVTLLGGEEKKWRR